MFGVEVFRLYKMMGWGWESSLSGLEALGEWVRSEAAGEGVWEAVRKTTSKSCHGGLDRPVPEPLHSSSQPTPNLSCSL